ncbi:unnamed protein product [Linum trigynum]|uniref:F-box domain-containing protein n=1 Tax=Linum trigynum TaxID=586398 RepID=A0AAV2DKQ4_9ROSI
MSKNRKAGKVRRRDRLSRLPEPIIHHILSFLDSKSSVQTSVLSRFWRCVWKHVPALEFNQYYFQDYSSFRRYVGKVLSRRYPLNLRKVSFLDRQLRSEGRDDSLVIRVIRHALYHDAQRLLIVTVNDMTTPDTYRFSDLFGSISSCNLKTLELEGFDLDRGFGSPGFRALTTLDLLTCLVACDQEVLEPFSNFSCLKHLSMRDCRGYESSRLVDDRSIRIYGLELLSLTLDSVEFDKIEIYAPKLKCFSVQEDVEYLRCSLSLPSLDHAEIGVHEGTPVSVEDDRESITLQLISVFHGLRNAKSLKLYGVTTVEVLSKFCELLENQPSPFPKLESLILDSKTEIVPYKLVNYFFKGSSCASPNILYVSTPS